MTAGGAIFAILDVFMDVPERTTITWILLGGVAATATLLLVELTATGSRHVELAVNSMTKGLYARQFWWGGVALGLVVPAVVATSLLAAAADSPLLLAAAGLSAIAGMFAYENAFIRAGQSVPLS